MNAVVKILLTRLRIGSELRSSRGNTFRVTGAFVRVSGRGHEAPYLELEWRKDGKSPETVVLPIGLLAHKARGSTHVRGSGGPIDWQSVPRLHQLERRGGTFTCRLGVAGQCWNPGQRVPSNPIIGPADVTYTLHYNGQVTAKVDRLD